MRISPETRTYSVCWRKQRLRKIENLARLFQALQNLNFEENQTFFQGFYLNRIVRHQNGLPSQRGENGREKERGESIVDAREIGLLRTVIKVKSGLFRTLLAVWIITHAFKK